MRSCSQGLLAAYVGALLPFASLPELRAQAPSSIGGHTVEFVITGGSGEFAASGIFRFVSSVLDPSYAIVPVDGDILASFGDFRYETTGFSTGILRFNDNKLGPGMVADCTFTSPDGGSFVISNPGAPDSHQQGQFTVFSGPAPLTIAGSTFSSVITSKIGADYNASGSYLFLPGTDGFYKIVGLEAVGNHLGTYSYEANSATTGILWLSDPLTGSKQIQQLSFSDANFGTYYLRNDSGSAVQTGSFTYTPAPAGAPLLSVPCLIGTQVQFTFAAERSRSYTIEFTPTVAPAAWQTLIQFTGAGVPTNIVVTDPVSAGERYYRAWVK